MLDSYFGDNDVCSTKNIEWSVPFIYTLFYCELADLLKHFVMSRMYMCIVFIICIISWYSSEYI